MTRIRKKKVGTRVRANRDGTRILFFLLFMDVESWQGGGIWRKKKNSSNLERRKSPPSHRRNHKLCPEFWKDCWAASLGIFKSNVFKKIINKSCCQSTSLELRVKIRSKFSTNSLKVDSSMGLYCRHSRINKYLHRNRHQKEKKKKKTWNWSALD